jgi:flagellar protein FlaG
VVRVVDTETNEVVRQIPNEDARAIARALDRLQGFFVEVRA